MKKIEVSKVAERIAGRCEQENTYLYQQLTQHTHNTCLRSARYVVNGKRLCRNHASLFLLDTYTGEEGKHK
jgi:hypothetical protein